MNSAVSLLAFFIFSFGIGLSGHIYAPFFVPPVLLFALKFSIARVVFTRLAALNIFAILSALSPAITGNFELAIVIFLRANLIMAFAILRARAGRKTRLARVFLRAICRLFALGSGEIASSFAHTRIRRNKRDFHL